MIKPGIFHCPKCFVGPKGLNGAMFWGAQRQTRREMSEHFGVIPALAFKGNLRNLSPDSGDHISGPKIILPAGQDQSLVLHVSIACPEI